MHIHIIDPKGIGIGELPIQIIESWNRYNGSCILETGNTSLGLFNVMSFYNDGTQTVEEPTSIYNKVRRKLRRVEI